MSNGKKEPRNFTLRDEYGNESGIYSGSAPRQAALKVANKSEGTKENPIKLKLREKGTNKIHVFLGWRSVVDAPRNRPSWLPDKIHKPNVKKIGVEKIE
jgi:hypothetical protein